MANTMKYKNLNKYNKKEMLYDEKYIEIDSSENDYGIDSDDYNIDEEDKNFEKLYEKGIKSDSSIIPLVFYKFNDIIELEIKQVLL